VLDHLSTVIIVYVEKLFLLFFDILTSCDHVNKLTRKLLILMEIDEPFAVVWLTMRPTGSETQALHETS
jgi:hypothetical protein